MAIAKAQPKPKVVLSPGPAPVVKAVVPKAVVPKAVVQPGFQTYKANVNLQPGQTLAFQAGKGYYAKAAPGKVNPGPPAPGDTDGGDGGNWNPGPNYGADLAGAPDFTEANANYQYTTSLAHDQRRNRVRAALIRLGFQPGSADAAALEGVDPSTADLAQNNSASAMAQLGLKRGTDRADLAAQLADRGLLDSGALRGGENMVQSSYDKGILGATQDYLNEQNAALGDEANTLATGQTAFTAAKSLAANAAAVNPLFTPTQGAAAPGDILAPGQGTRPDQTPVLAKAPSLAKPQAVKPPAKVVPKSKPKPVVNTKKPLR